MIKFKILSATDCLVLSVKLKHIKVHKTRLAISDIRYDEYVWYVFLAKCKIFVHNFLFLMLIQFKNKFGVLWKWFELGVLWKG